MKPVPPPVPSFDEPAAQWYCFACQFKNGPHEQGYCPLKQASVEPCRICNQVHFGIEGVCPALKSEGNIHQLNGALKNSTEEPYLVDMAKQYSNNSKAQIVKTKTEKSKTREEEQRAKIKRAQALASSGQSQMPGQPNQTPSTNGYGQRMQTNGAPNTPMNGNQNQAPQGYLTGSVPQAISSSRPSSATGLPQLGSFHSYGRMPSVYLPAASQLPYHSLHGAQT